jgi:hypothetical protein
MAPLLSWISRDLYHQYLLHASGSESNSAAWWAKSTRAHCYACLCAQTLTKRLSQINESLARKQQTRSDYEKVIQESESAYCKIVESSHTLLNVLKKEASSIAKRSVNAKPEGY